MEKGFIREFIKFVRLMDFVDSQMKFNSQALIEEVFKDIPMQIIKFYKIRGIEPLQS